MKKLEKIGIACNVFSRLAIVLTEGALITAFLAVGTAIAWDICEKKELSKRTNFKEK